MSLEDLARLAQTPICQQWINANLTRLRIYSEPVANPSAGTTEYTIELTNSSVCGIHFRVSPHTSRWYGYLSAHMANVVRTDPLFQHVAVLWAVHTPTAIMLPPAVLSTLPKLRMMRIADLGVALTGSDREYRKVCPLLVVLCAYNCNAPENSLDHIHRIFRTCALGA